MRRWKALLSNLFSMHNTKNTILVLVIIGLFVAAGLVLYNGFFAGKSVPSIAVNVAQKPVKNLMPYGAALDFTLIVERAAKADTFRYEMVDPTAVGVDMKNLITSPTATNSPATRR